MPFPFYPQVTWLFSSSLVLIALYWLLQVGRHARRRSVPRAAWWALPGLLLLLLTPVLDVPALFGVGAAALLYAEFSPQSYRRVRERPNPAWPLVSLLVGLALIWSSAQPQTQPPQAGLTVMVTAFLTLLYGAAGTLAAALYPPVPKRPTLGFQTRWNRTHTPEWPDLSVSLSGRGAHLKNVSNQALHLAGWSPVGVNAWFRVRDEQGQVLGELRAGQEALLPIGERDSGVRVWYGTPNAPEQALLFKADWTPTARADQRILN